MRITTITRTRTPCRYSPRYRLLFTIFISLLAIPFLLYHFIPSFASAADKALYNLTDSMLGHTSRGDYCTHEIGDRKCCMIYLDAAPCLDECRKKFVDRETLNLTLEYDQCADSCLAQYNRVCEAKENRNPLEGHYRGT